MTKRVADFLSKYMGYIFFVLIVLIVEFSYYTEYTTEASFYCMSMGLSLDRDGWNIKELMNYLLPWIMIHSLVGAYLYNEVSKRACYVLLRVKSIKCWYRRQMFLVFRKVLGLVMIYAVVTVILIILYIPQRDWSMVQPQLGISFLLTLGLALLLSGIQVVLILSFQEVSLSYCLIMAIQIISIPLATQTNGLAKYLIGNWSMYRRSTCVTLGGFSVIQVVIVEIVVIGLVSLFGDRLIKRIRESR